jgi:hypothetical protein
MNHNFMCKVVGHSLFKGDQGGPDMIDILVDGEFGHTSFIMSVENARQYPIGADVLVRVELAPTPVTQ